MNMVWLHRWNALFLGCFLVLHFVTHMSGVFGIEAYNQTQKMFRGIYQNPIVEPILLVSLALQIGWGAMLLWRKIRRGLRGSWDRVQVISGGVVLFFVTQHMMSFGISRLIDGLDTNFYWPASVMRSAPFVWYFVPYYFVGVVALFVHVGCAARLVLRRKGRARHATLWFWVITCVGVGIAVLIELVLLGAFYEITLPEVWITYLQRFVDGYQP